MKLQEIIKEDGLYRSDKTKTGFIYEVRGGVLFTQEIKRIESEDKVSYELSNEQIAKMVDVYFDRKYYKVESIADAYKQRVTLTPEHWKEIRAQVMQQFDYTSTFTGFVRVDINSDGQAIDCDGNFLNPITITI